MGGSGRPPSPPGGLLLLGAPRRSRGAPRPPARFLVLARSVSLCCRGPRLRRGPLDPRETLVHPRGLPAAPPARFWCALGAHYRRWCSATSSGSKPRSARLCSRSR
jgi:hypothetical protein